MKKILSILILLSLFAKAQTIAPNQIAIPTGSVLIGVTSGTKSVGSATNTIPASIITGTAVVNSQSITINGVSKPYGPSTPSFTVTSTPQTLQQAVTQSPVITNSLLTRSSTGDSIKIQNGSIDLISDQTQIRNTNGDVISLVPTQLDISTISGSNQTNISTNSSLNISLTAASVADNSTINMSATQIDLSTSGIAYYNGNEIATTNQLPVLTASTNVTVSGTTPNYTISAPSQSLSISGSTLSLSAGGGSVTIPTGSTTTLTQSTNITVTGSAPNYTISSPSQSLSISGNTISLSATGGSVAIPTQTTGIVSSQWITTGSDIYYNTGNVMVGSTGLPSSKLHIVETSTATTRGFIVDQYSNSTSSSSILMRKAGGTFASPLAIGTGTFIGRFKCEGYDGTIFTGGTNILSTAVGTIGTGTVPATMSFQTTTQTGSLTTALTLDQFQNALFTGSITSPTINVSSETASRVTILDANKNIKSSATTTTQLSYLDATSSIQNQLNTANRVIIKDITDGSAVTGTTSIVFAKSVLVPANTFTTGDVVQMSSRMIRSTATGTAFSYFYVNTTNSLSGATLIGQYSGAAIYFASERDLYIKSSVNSETLGTSVNSSTSELVSSGLAQSSLNIDWSQPQYIIHAIQNAANGNSSYSSGLIVMKK